MKETAAVGRTIAAVAVEKTFDVDFRPTSPFVLEIECYLHDIVQGVWSQSLAFLVTLSYSFRKSHILHLE